MELSDCASRLRHSLAPDLPALVDAAPLGPGMGISRVETARGVLLHAVRLEGETIADYAIIRPACGTSIPKGRSSAKALTWQGPNREATLERLRWLALSLDPGKAFNVILRDGANA